MISLSDILSQQGYASAAIEKFVKSAIAPTNGDDHEIEKYLNAIASNYYMQYLALKLEQYGFDLNRPDINAQQLSRADNLIKGKLGNPPLDNPYVLQFLESWVVNVRKKHAASPMSWDDLYHYTFAASDGVSLAGCEMVKALIRSDRIYGGDRAVHYRHQYQGLNFRTISMNELMAHILPEVSHENLQEVNKYGREVTSLAVDKVRNILKAMEHLPQPRLDKFYEINTHHRILKLVQKLRFTIHLEKIDFSEICTLCTSLKQEYYARNVYPDDWQRFLRELETALDAIAAPYQSKDTASKSLTLAEHTKDEILRPYQ